MRAPDDDVGAATPPTADLTHRVATLEAGQAHMARQIDAIHTAFVPDDLGRPGFDGHRQAHMQQIRRAQELDAIKMDATKRLVQGALALLGGAVAMGLTVWVQRGGGA